MTIIKFTFFCDIIKIACVRESLKIYLKMKFPNIFLLHRMYAELSTLFVRTMVLLFFSYFSDACDKMLKICIFSAVFELIVFYSCVLDLERNECKLASVIRR
jgi:hypothetical protein